MKKRYLILIGVATMVLGTTVYSVVRHARGHRLIIDRIASRMARHLDLTDVQQAQVRAIMEAERSTMAPLLAEAGRNRQQLKEATASGKFDEATVRLLAAQQAQTTTEMIVERERVKARIYNEVLTTEQRSRADQFFQRMQGRFHHRFRDGADGFGPFAP